MPLVEGDSLGRRMKAVALERDKHPRRASASGSRRPSRRSSLRQEPKAYMKQVVDQLQAQRLARHARAAENQLAHGRLPRPACRGRVPVLPAGDADRHDPHRSSFYLFVLKIVAMPVLFKLGGVLVAAYLGVKAPEIYPLERDLEAPGVDAPRLARRPRPAPDLRRIRHVDRAGLPARCRRGRLAIASPLAEELALTTAELSYLPSGGRPTRTSATAPGSRP